LKLISKIPKNKSVKLQLIVKMMIQTIKIYNKLKAENLNMKKMIKKKTKKMKIWIIIKIIINININMPNNKYHKKINNKYRQNNRNKLKKIKISSCMMDSCYCKRQRNRLKCQRFQVN